MDLENSSLLIQRCKHTRHYLNIQIVKVHALGMLQSSVDESDAWCKDAHIPVGLLFCFKSLTELGVLSHVYTAAGSKMSTTWAQASALKIAAWMLWLWRRLRLDAQAQTQRFGWA